MLFEPPENVAWSQTHAPETGHCERTFMVDDRVFLLSYDGDSQAFRLEILDKAGTLLGALQVASPPDFSPDVFKIITVQAHEYVMLISDSNSVFSMGMASLHILVRFTEAGRIVHTFSAVDLHSEVDPHILDIVPRSDGGFYAAGRFYPDSSENASYKGILLSIDAQNRLVWSRPFTSRLHDELTQILPLQNGHFFLVGSNHEGSGHGWFMELDASGNVLWDSEPVWSEWEKRETFWATVYYVQPTETGVEFVLEKSEDLRTYQVDNKGNILRQYEWPFSLTTRTEAGETTYCQPLRFSIHTDQGPLVFASCKFIQRTGRHTWEGTFQTVIFELE